MDWLIQLVPLSYTEAVVALGAAVLGLTAGVLGAFAVLRGRSLVGDALAHSALPGVAIAFIIAGVKDPVALLLGAGVAGLIGALLIVGIERTSRIRPDAAIGVVLSSFFSLGIVLLTYIAGTDNANQAGLDSYLFGQAAGLLERDLIVMTVLSLVAIGAVVGGYRALKVALFDPSFAASAGLPVRALEVAMTTLLVVAVVVGVRTVGAILMVALLVAPTVAARQLTRRLSQTLVLGGVLGAGIGVSGALVSMRADLPTGPLIVLIGFSVVVLAVLLAPGRGVLWRAGKLSRDRRRTRDEGVLVDLETAVHAGPPPTREELATLSGRPRRDLSRALRALSRNGMIARDRGRTVRVETNAAAHREMSGRRQKGLARTQRVLTRAEMIVSADDRIFLSERGAAAAHRLLERHELWSLWLEHGGKLDLRDAREPDPTNLRATLGEGNVAQLRTYADQAVTS